MMDLWLWLKNWRHRRASKAIRPVYFHHNTGHVCQDWCKELKDLT